jgi:hypothetical protein
MPDGGPGTGISDFHSNGTHLFATSMRHGLLNSVRRSPDEGRTWTRLGVQSELEFFTSVRSAPSRPQRIYVGAYWYSPPTELVYWSDDNGDTFTRYDVTSAMPMGPIADGGTALSYGAFRVQAVDPFDPDTVYANLQQVAEPRVSYVLRSADRGQTWSVVYQVPDLERPQLLKQIVLLPDGMNLWAATNSKLYRSTDRGATFLPLPRPTGFSCAHQSGGRLYACAWPDVDGYSAARWNGTDMVPVLSWTRISGPATCPPTSEVSTLCPAYWIAQRAQLFPAADAGTAPPPRGTCGCAQTEVGAGLLAALALLARRRRRGTRDR